MFKDLMVEKPHEQAAAVSRGMGYHLLEGGTQAMARIGTNCFVKSTWHVEVV